MRVIVLHKHEVKTPRETGVSECSCSFEVDGEVDDRRPPVPDCVCAGEENLVREKEIVLLTQKIITMSMFLYNIR